MVLEHQALYEADADRVQVAIVLQTDARVSAADQLKAGTATLQHGATAIATASFTSTHKVVRYEDDVEVDVGEFYCFFLHPPIQRHMKVKVEVELHDGDTAAATVPVTVSSDNSALAAQNPALAGRDLIVYDKEPDKP